MHDENRRTYCDACRAREAPAEPPCEGCEFALPSICEENWDAWQVYVSCLTQWRHAGELGAPTGLDYAAVESVMRILNVEDMQDCFWRVRVMEGEALDIISRRLMKEVQDGSSTRKRKQDVHRY